MEKSKKGYFLSFPNRSSFSLLSPPLSTPGTRAISKYALITSLQSMQMNGFSIQEKGYFSCFRTMFLRHDLGNFIPREREGGEGGGGVGLGIQGKTKFYTGRLCPEVMQTPHPFISYFCLKRYLFRVPSSQSLLTNGTPFTYLV